MNSLKLATPSSHHVVHVFEAACAQVGDDHVEAVIDAGPALGFFPPCVERVAHARAAGLDGEIDDAGGAAEGGGAGAGLEIIGRGGAAEGMSRCVWASMPPGMMYMPVASIMRAAAASGIPRDFLDGLAFDQDIGFLGFVCSDYGAVANQYIHRVLAPVTAGRSGGGGYYNVKDDFSG